MKKLSVWLGVLILAALATGCSDSSTSGATPQLAPTPAAGQALVPAVAPGPASGAQAAAAASASVEKKASQIKVTFVELGSVKCIPCKMMMPIMKEVEERFSSEVKVVFHDVWTEEGRPQGEKYGISSIPTQVFLDASGKEYFRHVGFFPKEELFQVLAKKGVNIN